MGVARRRIQTRKKKKADQIGNVTLVSSDSFSHRTTEFTGMCIAVVRGGKIVEAWNNFDFLAMYSQLGVLDKVGQSQFQA